MELADEILDGALLWLAGAFYALMLFHAVRMAPWRRLFNSEQMNVFLGSCVVLILLWTMRAEVNDSLAFHLLGVTALTLMFGWSLGVIGSSIVLVGVNINAGHGWDAFVVNALLTGVLPVTVSQFSLVLVRSLLPKNFFIYVLVNGFLTAGLAALVSGFIAVGLLIHSGGFTLPELQEGFMPFFPLMFMPEAFLNGWIITILVLYRPGWVYSFSDELYLKGK